MKPAFSAREKRAGWIYLAVELLILPSVLSYGNFFLGNPLSPVFLNLSYYLINFFAVIAIFHRFLHSSIRDLKNRWGIALLTATAGLMLFYGSAFFMDRIIAVLMPDFHNANDQAMAAMARDQWPIMAVSVIFLVPPAEELLFRGVIFGSLLHLSIPGAYLVSAIAFSAVHVVGFIGTLSAGQLAVSLISYLPAGLCLAWAFRRSGSLFSSILMHACINTVSIIAMR